MNTDELIAQKEKLEELKRLLTEKEQRGEIVRPEKRVYRLGKNLEIIDTEETRVEEKIQEICSHPMLWKVNYSTSNLEYYDPNNERTHYWFICLHCGKLITDKTKPKTENIIDAPNDLAIVYYFRKQILSEFQEEYFKILESNEEISIEQLNIELNRRFNKQKTKRI